MNDIFKDPDQLRNMSPDDVKNMAQNEGWRVEKMGQGTHKGQGLLVKEENAEEKLTNCTVQWHPERVIMDPTPTGK
jgi:hypothetical protein